MNSTQFNFQLKRYQLITFYKEIMKTFQSLSLSVFKLSLEGKVPLMLTDLIKSN